MAQSKINDSVKLVIVQALACYDTPTEVSALVKEEFDIDIPRQNIMAYNHGKHAAKDLSKKWVTIFEQTRKEFLKDTASIPIAQQSYRLRELDKLHKKTIRSGNTVLAAQLLEQASKEVGGVFTNKQKVDHSGVVGTLTAEATDAQKETIAKVLREQYGSN